MMEGYSPEKYKNAKRERLDPEKQDRLKELRELKEHWKTASLSGNPRDVLKQAQSLRYAFGRKLEKEHTALEAEHEKTKEGQIELAQAEAHILNDTLDTRAERLEGALAHKDDSPDAEAEYHLALADFNEFVEDLKESDLEKYASDIEYKQAGVLNYKKGVDADPWHPTPEANGQKLLEMLEKLPQGKEARELYMHLQDPSLSEKDFFDGIYGYRERMRGQPFDEKAVSHVIAKDLGNGRLLQVRFYDNGYIQFSGRDPEHDKKFSSSSGDYTSSNDFGSIF